VIVDGADDAPGQSPRASRRDNPLVIGLVKAMREAARATREETTARMRADATARIEEIRSGSVAEAAALRKRADDDAIGIREWSKAEIARIRDEAEKRIADRRAELVRETDAHASGVERLVEQVQEVARTFEAEMEQFFEVLLAEQDPARLATLAEQVPDAPVFDALPSLKRAGTSSRSNGTGRPKAPGRSPETKDAPEAVDAADGRAADARAADARAADATPADATPADVPEARLEPDAAAAAEAEAIADLDHEPGDGEEWTRVVVSGLSSVAGISAFKGALGHLSGVTSVSVSTGADEDFVFAVAHASTTDLRRAVPAFAGFGAQMTLDDGEVISFTVKEPR
jgi:hypothetical protein